MCVCVGGCVQTRCWLLPRLSLTQWRCFDFHLLELSDSIPLLYPEECSTYMHVSKRIYTPSHTHTHAKAHTHTHTHKRMYTQNTHTYIHTYRGGYGSRSTESWQSRRCVAALAGGQPARSRSRESLGSGRDEWKWQRDLWAQQLRLWAGVETRDRIGIDHRCIFSI